MDVLVVYLWFKIEFSQDAIVMGVSDFSGLLEKGRIYWCSHGPHKDAHNDPIWMLNQGGSAWWNAGKWCERMRAGISQTTMAYSYRFQKCKFFYFFYLINVWIAGKITVVRCMNM